MERAAKKITSWQRMLNQKYAENLNLVLAHFKHLMTV